MSTILVYTSPARGHLFPVLPTLLELQRRGHAVHVRTLSGDVERLRGLGLNASPMAAAIEARALDDWKAKTPLGAVDRAYTTWLDRAEHELTDVRDALESTRADLVFVDVNSWGAQAAAEASGKPFAIFSPYFLNLQAPGRPPFGLGLPPAAGAFGRLRDAMIWAFLRLAGRPYLRRLNKLRASLRLSPLVALDRLTERAGRVLAYTAEPFEYTHGGWPANVRLVGPGLWEPPEGAGAERGQSAGVGTLTESGQPLVLVTCSTELQHDGALIETALAALADQDVEVIATTAALDPAAFSSPANATIVRFAPHGPLLARAVAVVCHGGMGITQKALAAGIPVCVVPWGRDQNDVAQHVVRAGAGRAVPRSKLSVERLRVAIRETIALREGASTIAEAFSRSGGPGGAADVLEGLLSAES